MVRFDECSITRAYRIIGENIRRFREDAEMDIDEMAALSGLRRSKLAKMEAGTAKYGIDELTAVAIALDIPITVLVDGV